MVETATTRPWSGSGSVRIASPPIWIGGCWQPWCHGCASDFAFARVLFRAWAHDERQTAIFSEAGLRVVDTRPVRDTEALLFA